MTDTATISEPIVKKKIKIPPMWKVVFHNDNVTSMDFVVVVLVEVFSKTIEEAANLAIFIHETGKGVAGKYTFEIANQKKTEALTLARAHGYPLNITVEKE